MAHGPSPRSEGYRQPAESAPHRATWLAWPSHPELWREGIGEVRASFVRLCRALADETLEVLVPDGDNAELAREALAGVPVRLVRIPFGDIWLRDTAPIFVKGPKGVAAVTFAFNGWGGRYVLEHDREVSDRIASHSGLPAFHMDRVLEGG